MKFFLACLLVLVSSNTFSDTEIKKIEDPLLAKLLALGQVTDLNKVEDKVDKKLGIKIYRVNSEKENQCFPESHGICEYDYYVSTTQLDDSPIANAYFLGTFGEFENYHWIADKTEIDKAIIEIEVSKFSKMALNYNDKLVDQKAIYRLTAYPQKIEFIKK